MKIKLISNDEMVVSKAEYQLLKKANNNVQDLIRTIKYGEPIYYIDNGLYYPIVKLSNGDTSFPIKVFRSDDPDYNRVCAEELVELLNQEQ